MRVATEEFLLLCGLTVA